MALQNGMWEFSHTDIPTSTYMPNIKILRIKELLSNCKLHAKALSFHLFYSRKYYYSCPEGV